MYHSPAPRRLSPTAEGVWMVYEIVWSTQNMLKVPATVADRSVFVKRL